MYTPKHRAKPKTSSKLLPTLALTALLATSPTLVAANEGIAEGQQGTNTCISSGTYYQPPANGYATGPHCFSTPLRAGTLPAPLAPQDKSKTAADLERVENTSPLNPKNYLARDSYFAKPLTGKEPVSPLSSEIMRTALETNRSRSHYLTGSNIGDKVGANDNIPILTVDSSNPHQHFINVTSTDPRVTTSKDAMALMTGKIPVPKWYLERPYEGGDKAIAIYDVATGIWRSMFYFQPKLDAAGKPTGTYTFASGGFILGQKNFGGVGKNNYWLSLQHGTSSVVGLANELTQIGVDELKAGEIKHAISMTWDDYLRFTNQDPAGQASFPAKMTDGTVSSTTHPNHLRAGQRLTLPADFDVDLWAAQNKHDQVSVMIMRAIQKYGLIITDRNLFITAFNFESPYSYAPYARQKKNVYLEDPQLRQLMEKFNPHNFPLEQLQVIDANYVGNPADTVQKKFSSTAINRGHVKARTSNSIFTVDSIYSAVYQGETAVMRVEEHTDASPGIALQDTSYIAADGSTVRWGIDVTDKTGTWSTYLTGAKRFTPTASFVGTASVFYKDDWFRASGPDGQPIYGTETSFKPTIGAFTHHIRQKLEKVNPRTDNGVWQVTVQKKDQPLARTDLVDLLQGQEHTVNVLANDEVRFGAALAKQNNFSRIELLDPSGRAVTSYKDAYASYRLSPDKRSIIVDVRTPFSGYKLADGTAGQVATGGQGYLPVVKYRAYAADGKKSNIGYLQAKVYRR